MAPLPIDMVTEILLRLPVICLLKCLCVCKDWYRLIKSPTFVVRHLNHPSSHGNRSDDFIVFSGVIRGRFLFQSQLVLSYYCLDSNGALLPVPSSAPGFGGNFTTGLFISGPCNGIFCVVNKAIRPVEEEEEEEDDSFNGPKDSIFLCNPATRESRRLPMRPLQEPPSERRLCEGIQACGLGIDLATKEYKVVSVLMYKEENLADLSVAYRIGVYNLRSNSWREVETALPAAMRDGGSEFYREIWSGDGLYFNGNLHWGGYIVMDLDIILCFDLTNEVTGHLPLPPNVVPGNMENYGTAVMVLEDRIAVAAVATPAAQDEICSIFVWKMMDYGAAESWTLRFSISIPLSGSGLHPLSFWKDCTLLLLDRTKNELVSVSNVKEDGWRVKAQEIKNCSVNGVVLLKESLVPLHEEAVLF